MSFCCNVMAAPRSGLADSMAAQRVVAMASRVSLVTGGSAA